MEETKTLQEEYSPTDAKREKVRRVAVAMIDDFPEHPFKVKDDEEMEKLKDSISLYGVLTPVVARRCENGRYELISGHRRKYACKALGIEFMPAIVREMSREEAVIAMVDSNLQREHILPSEKAFAYKMKLEALKCQGKRTDLHSDPVGPKFRSNAELSASSEDSVTQIKRYIRLTELVPELLELVDDGRMAFRPAVEISYLTEDEQRDLVETIDSEDCTPSLSQACRMKKLSQEGKLDMDAIFSIMTEEKANQKEKIKIPAERLDRFSERGTPQAEIEKVIIAALEDYYARIRQRRANRDAR
mgnify:FL=1